MEMLRTAQRDPKVRSMYSLANYDILTNFHYSDAICYTTIDQRDKDNEHENSDIAANALLLGE